MMNSIYSNSKLHFIKIHRILIIASIYKVMSTKLSTTINSSHRMLDIKDITYMRHYAKTITMVFSNSPFNVERSEI
jgi:hypothetical protein